MISFASLKDLHRRSWRLIGGLVVVAGLATACGGAHDSDSASSDSAALAAVDSSATETTESAGTGRAQALAVSWVWCAPEGGRCSYSGSREIRYGTATQNVVRVVNGGATCSNATFGDPAPGVSKQCWYSSDIVTSGSTTTTATTTSTSSSTSWTACAWEGSTCSFSGTRTVRYGTTSANVSRTATSAIACSNAVFGDPAPGQRKQCWYSGTGTTTTTTTPTTTTPVTTGGSFSRTQVYPLRDQWVSGQPGQYTNLRLRFYGVPLSANAKVFVHLHNSSGARVAATGHHLRWIATASWRGYVQYDHPAYIPTNVAPGQYRIVIGLYYYQSPWTVLMSQVSPNGVSPLGTGYAVGTINVTTRTLNPVADQTSGPFVAINATAWY